MKYKDDTRIIQFAKLKRVFFLSLDIVIHLFYHSNCPRHYGKAADVYNEWDPARQLTSKFGFWVSQKQRQTKIDTRTNLVDKLTNGCNIFPWRIIIEHFQETSG